MKLQVTFDEAACSELKRVREKAGLGSDREVIGRALGAYEWLLDKSAEGYSVGAFSALLNDGHPVEMRIHANWATKAVRRGLYLVTTLLLATLTQVAHADRDPDFEAGLSSVPIEGSQALPGPGYSRPQLVFKDTTTARTVGTLAAVGGGLSLAAGWVAYIVRANYRLQPRVELGPDVIGAWETQGAWSLGLHGFGSSNLILAPYLLTESKSVPTLAWISGAVGLGVAAVGAGFTFAGQSCGPLALAPGSQFPVGCMSATADKLFGFGLLMTAAPLINWPISFLLRDAFSGPAASLTLGPGTLQYKAVF